MTFICKFCLSVMVKIHGNSHFSAFFHGGHIENDYFDNIACDLLLATCFIRKSIKIYRKKFISESPVGVFIGYFYIHD